MKIKNDNIVNVDVQTPREIDIKGDFLSTMICQNLDHARHVENERLSFNSIFLAAMAGFVAIAFGALDKPIILYPVLAFLFGLSYIGLIFTERWTAVYKGHFEKAKALDENFESGFAIILTNDSAYWSAPYINNTVDSAFRIHEGQTITGRLSWGEKAGVGTTKGRDTLELLGCYNTTWIPFSDIGIPHGEFRYCLIEVL